MTVRAVIVGIEKYETEALNVASPAINAVAMARWALASGVAAQDIFLFVSPLDASVTQELEAAGIQIRGATREAIDSVLRTDLPGVEAGSSLFFYWSGHGVTDPGGDRVLLCADYTAAQANRVFNATLFFRKLRSDTYEGYRKLLVLADVCGTNSRMPIEPDKYEPNAVHKRDQLIYFATPEGGFAKADTGEGAFTYCALKALGNFGQFPEFGAFKTCLEDELQQSSLPRFLLEGRSEDHEWESRVGRATGGADEAVDILVERLVALKIPHGEAERHFQATVSSVGNPRLLAAEGLTGMVRELGGLRDEKTGATHGLVQFVLRLIDAFAEHKPALEAWLAVFAKAEIVDFERERLRIERERSMLIIEVEAGRDGTISALRPSLRSLDQSQLRGDPLDPVPVRTWSDVEAGMLALLTRLAADGFTDIEIHFVVEATVFDRPFHRLPAPGGWSLGEEFGVVLHWRERVLPSSSPAKRAWIARFKAMRGIAPADLAWTRCGPGGRLPLDPDLCIVEHPPAGVGMRVLGKLVQLGAPGIYWPHDEDEADAEPDLTTLVRGLGTLAAMPDAIRQKRNADLAESGSLLWDAMNFRPYGGRHGDVD